MTKQKVCRQGGSWRCSSMEESSVSVDWPYFEPDSYATKSQEKVRQARGTKPAAQTNSNSLPNTHLENKVAIVLGPRCGIAA
jgi:hypothetical protein